MLKAIFSFHKTCVDLARCSAELIGLLRGRYTVLPAYSIEDQKEVFNLRHRVFCDELGYEPTTKLQIETDEHDAIADHILVKYAPEQASVGCARFIPGVIDGYAHQLPMERLFQGKWDTNIVQGVKNSGFKYVELSRLTIDKTFRRHGNRKVGGMTSKLESSFALLMTFFGIRAYVNITKTRYIFAMVEKKLINRMRKVGIPVAVLGEPVEFHGMRFPILIDMEQTNPRFPRRFMLPIAWRIQYNVAKAMKDQTTPNTWAIPATNNLNKFQARRDVTTFPLVWQQQPVPVVQRYRN